MKALTSSCTQCPVISKHHTRSKTHLRLCVPTSVQRTRCAQWRRAYRTVPGCTSVWGDGSTCRGMQLCRGIVPELMLHAAVISPCRISLLLNRLLAGLRAGHGKLVVLLQSQLQMYDLAEATPLCSIGVTGHTLLLTSERCVMRLYCHSVQHARMCDALVRRQSPSLRMLSRAAANHAVLAP